MLRKEILINITLGILRDFKDVGYCLPLQIDYSSVKTIPRKLVKVL